MDQAGLSSDRWGQSPGGMATVPLLGGAAAPVMEEPGLRWLDEKATGAFWTGTNQN